MGFVTGDDGFIAAYRLLDSGRTLTPDEFEALMDEWPDVVFFPAEEIPDPTAEAYWAVQEEALLTVTPEDLEAENRAARRVLAGELDAGDLDGAVDSALARARAKNPERARLAEAFVEGWEEACDLFWHPMRERAERLRHKK